MQGLCGRYFFLGLRWRVWAAVAFVGALLVMGLPDRCVSEKLEAIGMAVLLLVAGNAALTSVLSFGDRRHILRAWNTAEQREDRPRAVLPAGKRGIWNKIKSAMGR